MVMTTKQAMRAIVERLLQSPLHRCDADVLTGWTNSPMAIKIVRDDVGLNIVTTRGYDRRGVYHLPHSEKPKAYQFLSGTK